MPTNVLMLPFFKLTLQKYLRRCSAQAKWRKADVREYLNWIRRELNYAH